MAKGNATKPKTVPNKHLHSRISYLYQAATYLANHTIQNADPPQDVAAGNTLGDGMQIDSETDTARTSRHVEQPGTNAFPPGLPFYYASHLQSVSMKSQIRLSQNVKRSICKRCSAILIPGSTSSTKVENLSRGGKKPWADVLVIECNVCSAQKRFPVGAKRQPRKNLRSRSVDEKSKSVEEDSGHSKANSITEPAEEQSSTSITPLVEGVGLKTPSDTPKD